MLVSKSASVGKRLPLVSVHSSDAGVGTDGHALLTPSGENQAPHSTHDPALQRLPSVISPFLWFVREAPPLPGKKLMRTRTEE